MIHIKSPDEIEKMRKGGRILGEVLSEVVKAVKPGVTELELDGLAERLIREKGGEPGFMKVPGYKHTICACTNDVVVHGIPREYALKENDVICIDCGVYYGGFHTDMAETVRVTNNKQQATSNNEEVDKFLMVGKRALNEAIAQAVVGNRIGHISRTIEQIVEKEHGYGVLRSLIGHGVGRQLHEDPEVPGILQGPLEKTPLLKEGMTIAIEVIYNMGSPDAVYAGTDDWTIVSEDGSLSSVFERSVLITANGPEILTPMQ
jgi:methionyl aminopeptidase